jgi:hypothetical protein
MLKALLIFPLPKKFFTPFFFYWFTGSLGLVLNIFPLDMTVSERWLYFPLIGFLGLSSVLILENLDKLVISHKFVGRLLTFRTILELNFSGLAKFLIII